jgi:hypothetical protein
VVTYEMKVTAFWRLRELLEGLYIGGWVPTTPLTPPEKVVRKDFKVQSDASETESSEILNPDPTQTTIQIQGSILLFSLS